MAESQSNTIGSLIIRRNGACHDRDRGAAREYLRAQTGSAEYVFPRRRDRRTTRKIPPIWGKNFPLQYDAYKRTVDQTRTRYGGSEALRHLPTQVDPRSVVAQSKLEEDPRLVTMWSGYAFSTDFREERGHCVHARRPAVHAPGDRVQAAGHVPELPRLDVRDDEEARRAATSSKASNRSIT